MKIKFTCFFLSWLSRVYTTTHHYLHTHIQTHSHNAYGYCLSSYYTGCGRKGFILKSQPELVPVAFAYLCARQQTRIYFNKTETATERQTSATPQPFFLTGSDSGHLAEHRQAVGLSCHLLKSPLPASPPRSEWGRFVFPWWLDPQKGCHPVWQVPFAKIGQPTPKLKMSVKTNSISKGPCAVPSSLLRLLHQPRAVWQAKGDTVTDKKECISLQNECSPFLLLLTFFKAPPCSWCKQRQKPVEIGLLVCLFKASLFVSLLSLFSESGKGIQTFNSSLVTTLCICLTLFSRGGNLLPAQKGESPCCLYSSIILTLSLLSCPSSVGVPLSFRAKYCSNNTGS